MAQPTQPTITPSTGLFRQTRFGARNTRPVITNRKPIGYSATDNTLLLDITKSITEGSVQSGDVSAIKVTNTGNIPAFLVLQYRYWTDGTTDGGANQYVHYLLSPQENIWIPASRGVITNNADTLGGTVVTASAISNNQYTAIDSGNETGTLSNSSDTSLVVIDGDYYRVGDLLRLADETMEVTAISGTTLTVIRGLYGSTAATHSAVDVRLPYFNAYHDYDKYSVVQTDDNGRFMATNFFGLGRATTALQGIVPGSIAIQFCESGYQELGLAGVSASSNTGLTASTTYQFTIAVDGGSAYDLSFTTDSSDLTFNGSSNAVLPKIQDVFNEQYYTTGSELFEKRVNVGIVGGDVRFTSGSHLSTSAVTLGDSSGGNTDIWSVGRFPAVADATQVSARLDTEQTYNPVTYDTSYKNVFARDDGWGRLFGVADGAINYETGAITMTNAPVNAEFVISCLHTSAFAGKLDATEGDKMNSLQAVLGNITNQKGEGELLMEAF